MGVVYEAEHESLKSRVALKVVHPRFRADPKYLRRFHAEARVAAGLHHTNIVSVFDFGDHDGVCYYAMQYIGASPWTTCWPASVGFVTRRRRLISSTPRRGCSPFRPPDRRPVHRL